MATSKVTVTLQDHLLEEIRALVSAGQTPKIPAFVQHAVHIALHDAAGWDQLLKDALQQTGGPTTDKERALADAIFKPPVSKKRPGQKKAARTARST